MKILVVEDNHRIAQSIKKGLEHEAHTVDVTYDGLAGYELGLEDEYDIIILDLMLPEKSGEDVCRDLRKHNIHTPILMLTARDQVSDKVAGLDAGADDYLVKPFAFEELLARIRALSRRPQTATPTILKASNLSLNTTSFEVKRGKTVISLTNKEFALLEYFMRHPQQILSKDQIISHVWSYDSIVTANTVEAFVKSLRSKIDKPFELPSLLHTVRGFGYMFGEK